MKRIPDMDPKLWSFSAVIVGYLLIDDLTANEQNALGNWLMLTAQVLCTNAYYKQVQMERQKEEPTKEETIFMMEKMIQAMKEELDTLKKIRISSDFL